jgi:hypothetical protein
VSREQILVETAKEIKDLLNYFEQNNFTDIEAQQKVKNATERLFERCDRQSVNFSFCTRVLF